MSTDLRKRNTPFSVMLAITLKTIFAWTEYVIRVKCNIQLLTRRALRVSHRQIACITGGRNSKRHSLVGVISAYDHALNLREESGQQYKLQQLVYCAIFLEKTPYRLIDYSIFSTSTIHCFHENHIKITKSYINRGKHYFITLWEIGLNVLGHIQCSQAHSI